MSAQEPGDLKQALADAKARIAELEKRNAQLSSVLSSDSALRRDAEARIADLEAALARTRPQWQRELRDGQRAWRPDMEMLEKLQKK